MTIYDYTKTETNQLQSIETETSMATNENSANNIKHLNTREYEPDMWTNNISITSIRNSNNSAIINSTIKRLWPNMRPIIKQGNSAIHVNVS